MSGSPSRLSVADVLPGLLYSTGFLMVISFLPAGLTIAFSERYQHHSDWHWAIIAGAAMAIPLGIVGGLFLLIATLMFNRRGRRAAGTSK